MSEKTQNFTQQLINKLSSDANLNHNNEEHVLKKDRKVRVIFFVKQGLDSFLSGIIEAVSEYFEVKKILVTELNQIDKGMEWAEICWFEWCDELVSYGSKLEYAKEKKIICRLHSYEVFAGYINNVDWMNVDNLIVICNHIKNFIIENFKLDEKIIRVIPNGIDEKKWRFKVRQDGFNIAYVGYINYKKGPMLLLHTFKAIYEKDHRYRLYIAGNFQDNRDVLYYNQMLEELELTNSIIYEGWQEDLDKWLDDKNYILCTSVFESQNTSVMQAMCKGIKPIIHNFVGAKEIYLSKYVWNTIDEAISMIESKNYDSNEYRKHVIENYEKTEQLNKIIQLFDEIKLKKKNNFIMKEEPLVTVGITNYNYSKYLDQLIESILNQTYKNIEIIITDDCSTDDSVIKIKSYEKRYKNIRGIFHDSNSGNFYRGAKEIIEYSKGQYIMFISADDFLADKNVLKKYVTELQLDSSLDYVFGNIKIYYESKDEDVVWKYKNWTDDEIIFETFNRSGSGVIPFSIGLYKKEFYLRNNLTFIEDENNKIAGDTLNTLAYLKYGWKRKYIDYNAVCYRHHNNNMTYDLENRIKSIIIVMEYIVNNFNEMLYLKNLVLDDVNNDFKENKKNYLIGIKYYNTFLMYLSGNGMPWSHESSFDKEEIKLFLQPLIAITEKYMRKSLVNGNNLFNKDIKHILNEINKYKLNVSINEES